MILVCCRSDHHNRVSTSQNRRSKRSRSTSRGRGRHASHSASPPPSAKFNFAKTGLASELLKNKKGREKFDQITRKKEREQLELKKKEQERARNEAAAAHRASSTHNVDNGHHVSYLPKSHSSASLSGAHSSVIRHEVTPLSTPGESSKASVDSAKNSPAAFEHRNHVKPHNQPPEPPPRAPSPVSPYSKMPLPPRHNTTRQLTKLPMPPIVDEDNSDSDSDSQFR